MACFMDIHFKGLFCKNMFWGFWQLGAITVLDSNALLYHCCKVILAFVDELKVMEPAKAKSEGQISMAVTFQLKLAYG